ncbi:MAG TPA: S9 family peptidase [Candidatus Limnocylindrales bacterium]|nr:S9 family peptidase [Candidatus Limnocylindrales bacterium]
MTDSPASPPSPTPGPIPPVARRIPSEVEIHGERRVDDYFWLRQKDDPEVLAYLRAENAHTDAVMKPTKAFQEALYEEMLGRIKEDDESVPYRQGAHYYYARTEKGKQYPIMCRKAGRLDAPEEVTLDLNRLAESHPYLGVGVYTVSDDGSLLAYSLDLTGFRDYTLEVKDLRTGRVLGDRIEKISAVAWTAEPDVFFYVTEDDAKRPYRLWRHRLGAAVDDLLYEETDPLFRVHVTRTRSLDYVLAASRSFTSTEVRYLRASEPGGAWSVLLPREPDHEYEVDHGGGLDGDVFYIRTNGGGLRNFRLVVTPVADPRPANWQELLPHREEVMLEDLEVFAGHYVVSEREDGLVKLRITGRGDGLTHHVEFPEPTYDVEPEPNPEFNATMYRFRYQSMVTPASVFDYDVIGRRLVLLKQTEVLGGYDPARYRSQRLHATALDGTRIAISFVCRKDALPDGSSPLVLAGYGAYGYPNAPYFSSNRLSLLDRGVSVAIAHIRGGGEGGKRWHDAGRMMNKKNTFTDFIAAADFMVAEGHTSRDRLVIEGGSAGGLLIGAVLNLRPDLCRAAVLRVPFVDVINTMLDETLPLTVGEFEEWGNPKVREHYDYMKTYCPYTNIGAGAYPAILVRTGINDSQVMYWEPAKYIAKLRAMKTDCHLLLFKIDLEAGHGGPSGRYDFLREIAFDYGFILCELGLHSEGG